MSHCSQNNNFLKKISCVILAHIICLFYFHIYSPETKIVVKRTSIAKERSTVLNKRVSSHYQITNTSKKETSLKKEIKNTVINNNNTSQKPNNLAKKTITSDIKNLNKTETHTANTNTKKNTKNISELKNKFKELASQLESVETSSKQTCTLYEINKENSEIKYYISSCNQFTEQNDRLDLDVIDLLKDFLFLPDPEEEVILILSLSAQGDLLSLKIEKSHSKKNSEYCIKEIAKLPFQDVLQKHNLKQNVLFRIKLTT